MYFSYRERGRIAAAVAELQFVDYLICLQNFGLDYKFQNGLNWDGKLISMHQLTKLIKKSLV